MKQSAVEFLVELLNNFNDNFNSAFKEEIEQAKQLEKENTCYFGAKCCIMTTQKKEWTLEKLYKETFKTK